MEVRHTPNSTGLHHQPNRIAKNTMVLFLRMFVLMVVNLYIVRLVLKGLGDEDYGTFNAVAGVITSLTFVSSVLAIATQRFYSFTAGNGGGQRSLQDIFSVSLTISILFSLFSLFLFETLGLWYVSAHLPIPADRLSAALYVYHFSCLSFIFTLCQIPYVAAFIAHEDMGIYAIISLGECLLRLVVAFMLSFSDIDHLVFYGGGLMVVSFSSMLTYVLVGRRYPECHYTSVKERQLYSRLLSFSGWTLFGSLSSVALFQGNTVLLYEFFGPITAAAFAISIQVNHALNSLCNSSVLAFRPAMIRSYAEGRIEDVGKMFYSGSKFILYILSAIAIPLICEMDTILHLWLKEYSTETMVFCCMMVVVMIVMSMHHPITIVMHASGRVRRYHLSAEGVTLLCLPLNLFFFRAGFSSYFCFVSMSLVFVIAHLVRLICLRGVLQGFSVWAYVRDLILPGVFIVASVYVFSRFLHVLLANAPLFRLAVACVLEPLLLILLVYFIGLVPEERLLLRKISNSFIHRYS